MIKNKFFRKQLCIAEHQRVLMYKNYEFVDVLSTGLHHYWDIKDELQFSVMDINQLFFVDDNALRLLRKYPKLATHIQHWVLTSEQVGLVYVDGVFKSIITPNEHIYIWKDAGDVTLETISMVENIEVPHHILKEITRLEANAPQSSHDGEQSNGIAAIAEVLVAPHYIGLLYINGEFIRTLPPGHHGFWQLNDDIELKSFDTRTRLLEVSGQEILSKDRVSLRVNLTATIRLNDAQLAAESVEDIDEYIYRMLQLGLREAVGTKTLDDILTDKLYINETVTEIVKHTLLSMGVTLVSVGVKDIILPGEMKAILNQVVEAQKAAEANVIKRREETSATRSLHNTAKVMENNPTLMRLKELESLEKVAERIDSLTVHGGLEGLMNGVVKIA